jgi:hypothetical protein
MSPSTHTHTHPLDSVYAKSKIQGHPKPTIMIILKIFRIIFEGDALGLVSDKIKFKVILI